MTASPNHAPSLEPVPASDAVERPSSVIPTIPLADGEPEAIFVVGVSRSGTTLMRRVLPGTRGSPSPTRTTTWATCCRATGSGTRSAGWATCPPTRTSGGSWTSCTRTSSSAAPGCATSARSGGAAGAGPARGARAPAARRGAVGAGRVPGDPPPVRGPPGPGDPGREDAGALQVGGRAARVVSRRRGSSTWSATRARSTCRSSSAGANGPRSIPYRWLVRVPILLRAFVLAETVWAWSDAIGRHRELRRRFPDRYRAVRFEDLVCGAAGGDQGAVRLPGRPVPGRDAAPEGRVAGREAGRGGVRRRGRRSLARPDRAVGGARDRRPAGQPPGTAGLPARVARVSVAEPAAAPCGGAPAAPGAPAGRAGGDLHRRRAAQRDHPHAHGPAQALPGRDRRREPLPRPPVAVAGPQLVARARSARWTPTTTSAAWSTGSTRTGSSAGRGSAARAACGAGRPGRSPATTSSGG